MIDMIGQLPHQVQSERAARRALSRRVYVTRIECTSVIDKLELDAVVDGAEEQFDPVRTAVRPRVLDDVAHELVEHDLKVYACRPVDAMA